MIAPRRHRRRVLAWAWGLTAALLLSGCATIDSFSGSGSMRIDVEVYKGPLAQDPWTQFGELAGALQEASTALGRYRNFIADSPWGRKCQAQAQSGTPSSNCQYMLQLLDDAGAYEDPNQQLVQARFALSRLAEALQKLGPDTSTNLKFWADAATLEATRQQVRTTLRHVVEVATRLRGKAYFYAGNQVVQVPQDRYLRAYMATFAFLASEYSNQIATRADALLQQMAGPDRRELPLSLHLRNTHPSEFLSAFIWNRAAGLPIWEDMFLRPLTAFSKTETTERIRTYEQLFGDYNWSNVNTVYASGQGDVAMAFVKDDIGNWNLKSFDNDPTELLKSYVEVGKAALQEAVKAVAASTGVGGVTELGAVAKKVSAATELLDFANRVSYGRTATPSATVGGLDVNALHGRVVGELQALKPQAVIEKTGLEDSIRANETQISQLRTQATAARDRAAAERRKNTVPEAELRRRADDADREAYHQDRRAGELGEQIAELKARSDPNGQIPGLTGKKDAAEKERDRQVVMARDLRAQAAAAAQNEASAVRIEAEAKGQEEQIAAVEQRNQQTKQKIAAQPKEVAKAARAILDRYNRLIELLQIGATTAPAKGAAGAGTTTSLTGAATGLPGTVQPPIGIPEQLRLPR
jgi:hypothetical protein